MERGFLKCDTASQLIILRDAVKIEPRDLKHLFIHSNQAGGWSQHVTFHQLCERAAVSMVCKIQVDKQLLLSLLKQQVHCHRCVFR